MGNSEIIEMLCEPTQLAQCPRSLTDGRGHQAIEQFWPKSQLFRRGVKEQLWQGQLCISLRSVTVTLSQSENQSFLLGSLNIKVDCTRACTVCDVL